MIKKLLVITALLVLIAGLSTAVFAEETTAAAAGSVIAATATPEGPSVRVGGWVKMWIFDRPAGIGSDSSSSGPGTTKQFNLTKNYGVMFAEFDMIVTAKLSELVSFVVQPRWATATGATPKLGQVATGQTANNTSNQSNAGMFAKDMGHGVAEMVLNLPSDFTLEAGALRPLFSMDYGAELFFDEEMTSGKSTHDIMVVEDYGIGLAKSVSFGDLTIPMNLYILNAPNTDFSFENNNQPGIMLHIEPTYGILKLYGSALATRYDNNEWYAKTKYLGGFSASWEGLTLRSEVASTKVERAIGTTAGVKKSGVDQYDVGYYAKLFYRVNPWLQFMIHHDQAVECAATNVATRSATNNYLTNTIGAEINLSDSTIVQVNCEVGDWRSSDGVKRTVYTRPNIAVRSSF